MRAVLVFCEGNHDIAFSTRSLGALAGAQWIGKPIRDLPSPFGPVADPNNPSNPSVQSLITKRHNDRTLDDLKLKQAAHAPPPSFEAMVCVPADKTIYAFIRSQGDSANTASVQLLRQFGALVTVGVDVTEFAAAFLFDADDGGLASRETSFAVDHAAILSGAGTNAPTHAQWVKGPDFPVGLFVFHDVTTKQGTLESVLEPMVSAEWPTRWTEAGVYLTDHETPKDPVAIKASERRKAQICITGQFRFPGDPMTQVLTKKGLPDSHFKGPVSQALVAFLHAVPW